jgi:hypothetical protein
MATTSNAAMRKKTPFYVSIFLIHDTSPLAEAALPCVLDRKLLV